MNAIDAINETREVSFAGETFKVKRVSGLRLIACAEKYILKSYRQRMMSVAEGLAGKEKSDYLDEQTAKLPCGVELEAQALPLINKKMPDEVGLMIVVEGIKENHPEITIDKLALLTEICSADEMTTLIRTTLGKGRAPAPQRSKPSRKSAAGLRKAS